jgi:hypothetical protein
LRRDLHVACTSASDHRSMDIVSVLLAAVTFAALFALIYGIERI